MDWGFRAPFFIDIMKLKYPIEILDLHGEGFHLFLSAKAGRKKCRLLIDTGASSTVFDQTRLLKLFPHGELKELNRLSTGLGTDSMSGFLSVIPKLNIGGVVIQNLNVIVLNLSHVNKSYKQLGFPPIEGVLGSDLLHKFEAEIDYGNSEIRLLHGSKIAKK
jgi:hypothetical protein